MIRGFSPGYDDRHLQRGTPALSAYIRSLPKAELHLHLEGTVDPATLAELSRRHPTPLSTTNNRYTNIADSGRVFTEEEARQLYQYKNFTGFLLAFKAVTERLRTAEDYELVTYRMMQKLHAQNVLHAEVYVSVGVIHWRGGEFAPLFEGLERAAGVASVTSACRCTGSSTRSAISESKPRSGCSTRRLRCAKPAMPSLASVWAAMSVGPRLSCSAMFTCGPRVRDCAARSTPARPIGPSPSGRRCVN